MRKPYFGKNAKIGFIYSLTAAGETLLFSFGLLTVGAGEKGGEKTPGADRFNAKRIVCAAE